MLKPNGRPLASRQNNQIQILLQLVLFVDQRPSSQAHIQRIRNYLQDLQVNYAFDLQVIEVGEQPYLVEHFRLVATPALVKIHPEPTQTLAGSDLVAQLKKWWLRWQDELEEQSTDLVVQDNGSLAMNNIGYAAELMRLSDDIFRLQQENAELLEQLNFKDQVLAMLVHDLRSPLTAASIAVETLELSQNKETERAKNLKQQLFKQARAQFRSMNRMINDILQAAKGKNAELKLKPRPLYFQDLCQEIITQVRKRVETKGQELVTDLPQDLPTVYADPELMRQVIINLLDNAIKYTPEGGTIQLSILHRTTQKIQVSVCDTGPGIPLEKRDLIFEGHFRLQRDQEKEGYGLGLSLCQKVIRLHYGHIWVDDKPNQGSCFHFTLPVYRK